MSNDKLTLELSGADAQYIWNALYHCGECLSGYYGSPSDEGGASDDEHEYLMNLSDKLEEWLKATGNWQEEE
jgi:hypothetical protein